MRILYVNNYQGPKVLAQRGQRRNRALGASRKVELITHGLQSRGHHLHVLSAGTVSESSFRIFSGFDATEDACGGASVTYLAGVDAPRINLLLASVLLDRKLRRLPIFDVVLLYNLEWYFLSPTVRYAARHKIPIVVEYEDDAAVSVGGRLASWHRARGDRAIRLARRVLSGVVAVAPELAGQLGIANGIVLPGVVGSDILEIPRHVSSTRPAKLRVVYAGGLTAPKGPDLLMEAASRVSFPIELDIVGSGAEEPALRAAALRSRVIVRIHGEVAREQVSRFLREAHLAVNPHRMDGRIGAIFPFKIAEYVGAGLPVVTSRFGECPLPDRRSLVTYQEDNAGSLAAALESAWNRWPEIASAARSAREWIASEYSTEATGLKIEEVLHRAIES